MMEKEAFIVVSKIGSNPSESLSSSSFVECSLPSCHEKALEASSTTINKSSVCDQRKEDSISPEIIDKKLDSLLAQTTQLTEKFESRNQSLRRTLTQMSEKQHEIPQESKTVQKEKEHCEATNLSDDECDYSIITPSKTALQRKADEITAFQDTLLELHELKGRHTKVSQELVEERLRMDNLSKLLTEKDEQNRILKEFFDTAKQQVLKNVQLQSELDSVKEELRAMKQEAEQLRKKCEESDGEVEACKEELLNLRTSHVDADSTLQAEITFLREALRDARNQQDTHQRHFVDVSQQLEKLSKDNHQMVELLSTVKMENEQLRMERTVKACEYQEELDGLTAKLVDREQRLEHMQIKLSVNIGSQKESSPFASLTDNPSNNPSEQCEETSVKSHKMFRCPHCSQPMSDLTEFEEHLQICNDFFV